MRWTYGQVERFDLAVRLCCFIVYEMDYCTALGPYCFIINLKRDHCTALSAVQHPSMTPTSFLVGWGEKDHCRIPNALTYCAAACEIFYEVASGPESLEC